MNNKNNFDLVIDRENTNCIKWDRRKGKFKQNVLPLWIADTDFPCPVEITDAIKKRCSHSIFGYSFAPKEFATSIAEWFNRRHGLYVNSEWITASCGVITSVSYAIQALTKPGDKVVIQPPVYDPFSVVIEKNNRIIVENPLTFENNSYTINFEHLEQCFAQGVSAMILCNPHNPVGRVWSKAEITHIVTLCKQYNVYLISDEIHCDITLFNSAFTSILDIPQGHDISISCIAPGKTFNISGLAISATMIPNKEIREKISAEMRSAWLLNPSLLSIESSIAAYTYGDKWLDDQIAYIEENVKFCHIRLKQEAPHIRCITSQGTFLLWLDFSDFPFADEELSTQIIEHCHLGLNDGFHFGTGGSGFMRMNVGCTRSNLKKALDALVAFHQQYFPN